MTGHLALALLAIVIYRSGFPVWPIPIAAWHRAMAAILPRALTRLLLMLVRVLNALSREKEAAALADQIEGVWGDAPEVRAALQVRQTRPA